MNKAKRKDVQKEYLEAIRYYEENIISSNSRVDDYTNLAFLYWSFAYEHIEFNIPNNILDELSIEGGDRFMSIINLGLKCFPNSLELNFWKKYYQYRCFVDEVFEEQDCVEMILIYENDNPVIYFFLQLYDKIKYKKEVESLRIKCLSELTAKHLYILTFI